MRLVAFLTLAVLTAGCGGAEPAPEPPAASPTPTATSSVENPLDAVADPLSGSRPVRFRAPDGIRLEGRVFGGGHDGVVLAHMGGSSTQGEWFSFAAALAARGYRVLTYNRRGTCPGGQEGCSSGGDSVNGWRDVVGAVKLLRSMGADRVAVGGASLGAMESLYVAGKRKADVDAVIWVAGVELYADADLVELVRRIRVPKLFLSGEHDSGPVDSTERLHEEAPGPKELVLLDTGEHGTDILAYEDDEVVAAFFDAVVQFLAGAV